MITPFQFTFICIMLIQNYGVTPRSSTMMNTIKNYLIRDLAQKTHLSTDTIRFYEKKQLIQPCFRGDNNYRLIFIKRCRALDMSLQEISQLVELVKQPQAGCQVVDQMIEQHIQQVEEKISELQTFYTQLQDLRKSCSSDTTIDH